MVKNLLFSYKIKPSQTMKDVDFFLPSLSTVRQKQVKKFRNDKSKLLCIFSQLLFKYSLIEYAGIDYNNLEIKKNAYGKPFLPDYPTIKFNISHTWNWVVCAISSHEVGVDIETIQEINYSSISKYFSIIEKKTIEDIESHQEKLKLFFDYWTLKESFIKNIGKGLSCNLSSFTILLDKKISIQQNIQKESFYFKQYNTRSNHSLSLCLRNDSFPQLKTLSDNDILFR